jgi:hypothetical protein
MKSSPSAAGDVQRGQCGENFVCMIAVARATAKMGKSEWGPLEVTGASACLS